MKKVLPPPTEDLLAEMKRSWTEDARFFSNAGKSERERWVVAEFLRKLNVLFEPHEVRSRPQHSKVDVDFRQASFQVKEIVDPSIRRTAEIKAISQRVLRARTLADTIGPPFSYDVPLPADGSALLIDTAAQLAGDSAYAAQKGSLDLLCYITRTRASAVDPLRSHLSVASLGWRSVSCLMGDLALVVFATAQAPEFLRERCDNGS